MSECRGKFISFFFQVITIAEYFFSLKLRWTKDSKKKKKRRLKSLVFLKSQTTLWQPTLHTFRDGNSF